MRRIGLRQMQAGQKGSIISVDADGELGRRIRDMGLIPGTDVEIVGRAPLRDPVALRLFGVTLALRNREADYITVEVASARPMPIARTAARTAARRSTSR